MPIQLLKEIAKGTVRFKLVEMPLYQASRADANTKSFKNKNFKRNRTIQAC
jgi:hypothetical protein